MPGAAGLVAVYLLYMLAAGFGRWMTVIPDIPITVWPPSGVILAMLLIRPRQSWPWWIAVGAAGELTGNLLWYDNPLIWALGYILANAAAVLSAALLLAPYLGTPIRRFDSLRQVLAFLVVGVIGAPVISATLGSAIDAFVGKNPFSVTWPVWWLGDATGILIATPLVISLINMWHARIRPDAMAVVEGAAIGLLIFGLTAWEMITGAAHAFILPLPILWAALRFEFRGATLAVLSLALAIGTFAQGFHTAEISAAGVVLLHTRMQMLLLVAAATGVIVAAITRQQREAVAGLARANSELEARVAERTRAIEAAEERFRATFQNAGVGISIVGGDGRLLRVNESLARMLGREVADMEGHPLDDFTHPDDLALNHEAWQRLQSGTADEYDLEKRYLHADGVVVWGHTTVSCVRHPDGRIAYLIKIIQDITARRRSDDARQMLMREVNHRSKNLLSIVQVIARQTANHSPQEFVTVFGQRLQALAANQDLLVNNEWQRIDLTELVESQLRHFGAIGQRVRLSGPAVVLPPAAAQTLGMALHELATNAAKYGSLSVETGCVDISWSIDDRAFHMSWRETGGPDVQPPAAKGFGSTVLDTMTAASMSGKVRIDYSPEGLLWELRCPRSALRDGTAAGDPAGLYSTP
ncbi:MASE1 domain-containing protein [Marinovum sp.]|uniref:MASE1 domain-containing protein n=1 Tax=Marinovum sp. TaxID=2024839 RepID=UPI002B26B0E8|nr:MASE1 domain-containing protein [Marinovum sp.]